MTSTCDIFDGENKKICEEANEFARRNKNYFVSKFADIEKHPSETNPVSVFMAGSPGAGKTEFSKRLISELRLDGVITSDPVRIDPDEVRAVLPNYTGDKAYIFQSASAIGVEKLYDYILQHKQSAIIDGTFGSTKSINNVQRSIDKNRPVEIFYLYQEPELAWEFTKKREALDKRMIPRASFIESFISSRENVNKVKEIYGDKVRINLVIKDFSKDLEELKLNVDKIDHHLKFIYTKNDLEKIIK